MSLSSISTHLLNVSRGIDSTTLHHVFRNAPLLHFLRPFSSRIAGSRWKYLSVCLSGLPSEDEDESHKLMLFGSKVTQGQIEATVISLAVVGVLLLLAAGVLLGAVIRLERQRKLRRNRRSILDDGFKLMSQKNSGLWKTCTNILSCVLGAGAGFLSTARILGQHFNCALYF